MSHPEVEQKRAVKRRGNESWLAYQRKYRNENREKLNEKRREKMTQNLNFRLGSILRTRLGNALRRQNKAGSRGGSAVRDLGCTIPELKTYLEARFAPGMTWDNYGEWHIDHVMPLVKFDLTDPEQVRMACHYTNLQPLWAKDNISKGGRHG